MLKNQIQINRFKISADKIWLENDSIAVEEPLQISLSQFNTQQVYSLTMRTPGDDHLLVHGLLFTEGVIQSAKDIISFQTTEQNQQLEENLLCVEISANINLDLSDNRRRHASYSGCGLCGKTSLKALALTQQRAQNKLSLQLDTQLIKSLKNRLAQQPLFSETGGSHVAGLIYEIDGQLNFERSVFFEDVGRHNALDKLIGYELITNDLQQSGVLVLSGRLGFELVQKSVMAGFSIIVALGAPSNLAIQAANQFDICLIGFAKDHSFNLYTAHKELLSK